MPDISVFPRLLPAGVLVLLAGACSTDISNFSMADLNPLNKADPLRSADYNYFYRRDQVATGLSRRLISSGPDGRCAFEAGADICTRARPVAAEPVARRLRPIRSTRAAIRRSISPRQGGAVAAPGAIPPVVRAVRAASRCR